MPRIAVFILSVALARPAGAGFTHALDRGRYHLGDGAYTHTTDYDVVDSHLLTGTHLAITFRLSAPTTVAVTVEHLWGVGGVHNTPHNNVVYLDAWRVGRILPGSRGVWTSAGRQLRAGRHRVKIVSDGPGDHDDFVLEGVSVITVDRVGVEVQGPAEIWTERREARIASALGATEADISAWIQMTADSWERIRREREAEEQRAFLVTASTAPVPPAPASPIPPQGLGLDPSLVFHPSDPPDHQQNAAALRLRSLRLESPDDLRAGGIPPAVVLECEVDEVYVARSARPSVHWRWIPRESGTLSVGGGPMTLREIDRTDPTFRVPLPLAPPTPGRWTLELTVTLGQFGDTGRLVADVTL